MNTAVTGSLAEFDHVGRGDPAPDWVHAGICARWSLDPANTRIGLIAVSENVTFKVTVGAAATMVVRLGRPGYAASLEHVRSELLWIEALKRDAGIPTPSPLHGLDDELVQIVVDGTGAGWTAVAFEFVPGAILEDQTEFTSRFEELGRLTALLHAHSRSWSRPSGFVRFDWGLDDMTGPTARWGDWRDAALTPSELELLDAAEQSARKTLAGLERSPENWGLIHSDLRPSNVMIAGDQVTVIDFDDSGNGYYLYDLAAALTFYEHRPEAPAMAAAWLEGYQQQSVLSRVELETAAALSMMRRLTMLGWAVTHREDALPADLWRENRPGTLQVAEHYLQRPLWLFG